MKSSFIDLLYKLKASLDKDTETISKREKKSDFLTQILDEKQKLSTSIEELLKLFHNTAIFETSEAISQQIHLLKARDDQITHVHIELQIREINTNKYTGYIQLNSIQL